MRPNLCIFANKELYHCRVSSNRRLPYWPPPLASIVQMLYQHGCCVLQGPFTFAQLKMLKDHNVISDSTVFSHPLIGKIQLHKVLRGSFHAAGGRSTENCVSDGERLELKMSEVDDSKPSHLNSELKIGVADALSERPTTLSSYTDQWPLGSSCAQLPASRPVFYPCTRQPPAQAEHFSSGALNIDEGTASTAGHMARSSNCCYSSMSTHSSHLHTGGTEGMPIEEAECSAQANETVSDSVDTFQLSQPRSHRNPNLVLPEPIGGHISGSPAGSQWMMRTFSCGVVNEREACTAHDWNASSFRGVENPMESTSKVQQGDSGSQAFLDQSLGSAGKRQDQVGVEASGIHIPVCSPSRGSGWRMCTRQAGQQTRCFHPLSSAQSSLNNTLARGNDSQACTFDDASFQHGAQAQHMMHDVHSQMESGSMMVELEHESIWWFTDERGTAQGPLSLSELRHKYRRMEISVDTICRDEEGISVKLSRLLAGLPSDQVQCRIKKIKQKSALAERGSVAHCQPSGFSAPFDAGCGPIFHPVHRPAACSSEEPALVGRCSTLCIPFLRISSLEPPVALCGPVVDKKCHVCSACYCLYSGAQRLSGQDSGMHSTVGGGDVLLCLFALLSCFCVTRSLCSSISCGAYLCD